MVYICDPKKQRKAMTEAGFSVSEQQRILAAVQEITFCSDEKPAVHGTTPCVDHDALAVEVSQVTGIELPTTFHVLTWELVLESYRPQKEVCLDRLAADISAFTGIEESRVYRILCAEDDIYWRDGINELINT